MKRTASALAVCMVLTATWTAAAQRLTVSGTEILCNGSRIWLNAVNTPWNSWNDFGGNYNSSWWDAEFAQIKAAGGNATRIWINCNGDGSIAISADGTVSGASSKHWSDLDDLFALAREHEIYVMATLLSFDHTTSPNTKHMSWRAMYGSNATVSSFIDTYVVPFVNRYKDNPYLAMIEPCNEIEWVHVTPERGGIAWARLQYYVARVAAAVHNNSDVLVTQGCNVKWQSDIGPACEGNFFSDANLKAQYDNAGSYLDIYSPHWYDWVRQHHGDPFADKTPADYGLDDKPCILGECPANGSWVVYRNAFDNGYEGVFAWTSNGVDGNGSLESGLDAKLQSMATAYPDLITPSVEPQTGPFTMTVTQPTCGTVTVSPEKAEYASGDTVTVTAQPDGEYTFQRWSGDASGSANPLTIVMTRNMTISAVFGRAGELLTNGTFDNGTAGWSLGQGPGYGNSAATASVSGGAYQVAITNAGSDVWHVQVVQGGLALEAGRTYTLSFDISAAAERTIFVAVGEAEGEYRKFAQETITIGPSIQTHSMTFTPDVTVTNARVELNLGLSAEDITLDNVSLMATGTLVARYRNGIRISARSTRTRAAYDLRGRMFVHASGQHGRMAWQNVFGRAATGQNEFATGLRVQATHDNRSVRNR